MVVEIPCSQLGQGGRLKGLLPFFGTDWQEDPITNAGATDFDNGLPPPPVLCMRQMRFFVASFFINAASDRLCDRGRTTCNDRVTGAHNFSTHRMRTTIVYRKQPFFSFYLRCLMRRYCICMPGASMLTTVDRAI